MLRTIVKYGDPILTQRAEAIGEVDDEIHRLVEDMVETMREYDGVGLAANQVGELKRVAVIDPSGGEDPGALIVLINPEIVEFAEEEETVNEGCLSFPEIRLDITRSSGVTVEAQNMEGEKVTFKVDGLLARVFQHEIDHLNGVLFIDYIRGLSKHMVLTKIKNMKKRGEWD